MLKVKYSRARLSGFLVLALAMIWGGFWVWSNFTGKGAFFALLLAAMMIFCLPIALRYLLLDNTILSVRGNVVEFHGVFGTKRFSKEDVLHSSIETNTTNGVASSRQLLLGEGGYFFAKRVSEQFLETEFRPIERLIVMILEGGSAPARSEVRPAQRQEPVPQQPAAPPVRTFGRKSV